MFSHRLSWDSHPNAISLLLARKKAEGAEILDLTESNPTQAGILYPEAEILAGFQNPAILTYGPDSAGLLSARNLIANAFHLDPATLILTSSTSEAYTWIFKLLCDPGDSVLVPQPSYPLFDYLAALENVGVIHYPLSYHGAWSIDIDTIRERITNRTRAIVVVNPNNPTGSYVSGGELAALAEICREYDLAIISDEVFAPFSFAPDRLFTPIASATGVTAFSLNGLSKLIGMPQMKLGWIQTNNPAAHNRLELIADTYLSVGTPVQYALPALLNTRHRIQDQIRKRLAVNLAELQRTFLPRAVEGGWYAVLQVSQIRSEEEWVLGLLEQHNVLVQPGYFYDFLSEAFLILSLLTLPETFREGLRRLTQF